MPKKLPKIDTDSTVIVEVLGGLIIDYMASNGIKVIIVDRDVIKEEGKEEQDAITRAAMSLLDRSDD